jgi:hypothetical protein
MAQTTVNFLYNEFLLYWYGNSQYESSNEIIEKAKTMEREQMIDFAKQWEARQNDGNLDTIEMLYNETYTNGL